MLFIPGHKTIYLKDLNKIIADIFVLDLEDAVPLNKKEVARNNLKKIKLNKNFYVRINNDKKNLKKDIQSCVYAKINSFVLPKIEKPSDVKRIEKNIYKISKVKKLNFFILIESTKAIINLKEICKSSKNIIGLIFGSEDYLNSLNILDFNETQQATDFPRTSIPIYANAFNLYCIDTPFLNLTNFKKYKEHLKISKSLGYDGILNIHPSQCKLANENYLPSKLDYVTSKKILKSNQNLKYKNQNISVLKNKLVGPPMIKRAQKILDKFNE